MRAVDVALCVEMYVRRLCIAFARGTNVIRGKPGIGAQMLVVSVPYKDGN